MNQVHELSLQRYSLKELFDLAVEMPQLKLSEIVCEKIRQGAAYVKQRLDEGAYIYGVTSGFGSLCETEVKKDEQQQLQINHILSHACGVGPVVSEHISRLTMLIKLLTLRWGATGISLGTVQDYVNLWNAGLIPTIPKKGTVGASGDLAPLAHLALPLLGQGQVYCDGVIVDALPAMKAKGLALTRFQPKDGLALTNGVQYIDALATDSIVRFATLVKLGDLIAALSIQGFSCSRTFYHPLYHTTSFHKDRHIVSANLEKLLAGSNHFDLPSCNRSMQDPYSFRCCPQVHAAVRQTLNFASQTLEDEVNGVSDNPLFFPEENKILFGGNLHGESTAMACDYLAIAVSEMANISERRTYQLLSGARKLPNFLVAKSGLNSGLMIPQYTSAALVNENKVLCTPACIDTIPTCQLQEDHVSMGGTSAYKLSEILNNTYYIMGIELLTATQAIDCNNGLRLSGATRPLYDDYRAIVPLLEDDRNLSIDLENSRSFLIEKGHAYVHELQ